MSRRRWRRFGVAAAAVSALVVGLLGPISPAYAASSSTSCTSSLSVAEVQEQILTEVNAARKKAGSPALTVNAAMNKVAVKWSKSQAKAATMKHSTRTSLDYTKQIPKGWTAAGENVAFGYTPTAVTGAWLKSAGHRKNIESASFTHIGIGVACSATDRPYYTQVFGAYKKLAATTPKVDGTPKAGVKLVAKTGKWTSGTKLDYQWYVGGKAVSGATSTSYVPKAADAGKAVKVKVTGAKTGYAPIAKVSKATPKVAKPSTLTRSTPTISGTVKVGKKLTTVRGTWTTGTKFTYQWYRSGKAIKGATKSAYTLKAADKGKTITVKVTGKKAGYKTASKTSAKTAKVT